MAAAVVVSACQSGGTKTGAAAPTPTPAPTASITFSVRDFSAPVRPDTAMTVSAENGKLSQVRLVDEKGTIIPGRVVDGTWQMPRDWRLRPDTAYTWRARAENGDGKVTEVSRQFRTIEPEVTATYRVTPDGVTMGVGMPVMVAFDSPVQTPEMRADVERRMSIKVTPAQSGSWGWVDDSRLMWRPVSYWKPGTKVVVKAPLHGVRTGEDKWIAQDKGAAFSISKRGRVSKVDLANHVMTVTENGKRVATYPISAGKATADWETRSGTKVITEKHESYVMDAGTLGLDENDPNYYKTEVKYAMRVTNTGEFLHSAPWSVWAQGRRNVSHGCVNMGPHDAAEMFRNSMVGDVVEFVNSGRRMKPGDGLSVWLYSPAEWKKLSAL